MREIKSRGFLTSLLVVLSSFPPLTTDMYLPTLNKIAIEFRTTDSIVGLTMVLFFIFFSISTLLWGPISDKYGRKKSLFVGVGIYIIASIICMVSTSVTEFIVARVFQALGSGAPVTVSIAIVQDIYKGEHKKKVLSILSALMMVAPVVAPLFGTFVASMVTWRGIFAVLSIVGVLSFIGSLFIAETNLNPSAKSVFSSFSGLFLVLKDSFFRKSVIIFSLPNIVVLGFVGGSAAILQSGFGISGSLFSIYFASNAVFSILGSLVYVPLSRKFSNTSLIISAFGVTLLFGVAMFVVGSYSAVFFMCCMIPASFVSALLRPLGMNLMMENSGNDAGSTSSVINFLATLMGSLAMEVVVLEWSNRIAVFACLIICTGLIGIVGWKWVEKKAKS